MPRGHFTGRSVNFYHLDLNGIATFTGMEVEENWGDRAVGFKPDSALRNYLLNKVGITRAQEIVADLLEAGKLEEYVVEVKEEVL
jgi:hypothetical protein